MTPGTVVEVVRGPWQGRFGVVEPFDPEWGGVREGGLVLRLRAGCAGRPTLERVVIDEADVVAVDLRMPRGRGA